VVVDTFTPGGGYAAYSTGSFALTAGSTIAFVGLDDGGQDIAFIDQLSLSVLVQ
jgi:hypothetical protein